MEDYYSEYIDFSLEIENACNCINAYRCNRLNDEIINIKDTVKNLQVGKGNWDDSVGDTINSVIMYCTNSLNDVINSIDSSFTKAESIYEDLKKILADLKNANNAYQKRYKEKPNSDDYYHNTKVGVNENGEDIYNYQLDHREYHAALDKWNRETKELAAKCEDLITQIEANKKELEAIDGEKVNIQNIALFGALSNNITSFLYYFVQNPEGSVADYLKKNGGLCYGGSYFGTDYATVLNVKGGTSQSHDKCLGTAMGYINEIYKRTGLNKENVTCYSTSNKNEILNIMANEVLNGKPVVIEVGGKKQSYKADVQLTDNEGNVSNQALDVYSRHYVTVFGIKKNADLNNLKESDFLILDPGSGKVKQLDTQSSNKKLSTRSLLNGQAATYNPYDNDYFISVYNDDSSKYVSSSCKTTKYESQDAGKNISISC